MNYNNSCRVDEFLCIDLQEFFPECLVLLDQAGVKLGGNNLFDRDRTNP